MQYAIIALIVLVAAALVIVPLVRSPRGAGAGDLDEPAPPHGGAEEEGMAPVEHAGGGDRGGDIGPSEPETAGYPPERVVSPPPAVPRTTPERTVPPSSAPQPPGESGAEELPQSAPPPAGPGRPLGARKTGAVGDAATEEEILRYREALRARTICEYCSTANPPGSKYCKECGELLEKEEGGRGRRG